MPATFNGRYTAHLDGSFGVFLVGRRINRRCAVRKGWPVAQCCKHSGRILKGASWAARVSSSGRAVPC